MTVSLH
jgi:hypothetical protein